MDTITANAMERLGRAWRKQAMARWRLPDALAAMGVAGRNRLSALSTVKQKLGLGRDLPGAKKMVTALPESVETTALINSRLPSASDVLMQEPKHVWRGFASHDSQVTDHLASHASPSASYASTYGYGSRRYLPTTEGYSTYHGLAKYPAGGLKYGPDGSFGGSGVGSKAWGTHATETGGKVPAYNVSDANVSGVRPQEQFLVVDGKAKSLPARTAGGILGQLFKSADDTLDKLRLLWRKQAM